jgi:hypothetical protein
MNIAATTSGLLLRNTLETAGLIKGIQSLQTAQKLLSSNHPPPRPPQVIKHPRCHLQSKRWTAPSAISAWAHTQSPFEFIFYFCNPSHTSSQYVRYSYVFRSAWPLGPQSDFIWTDFFGLFWIYWTLNFQADYGCFTTANWIGMQSLLSSCCIFICLK